MRLLLDTHVLLWWLLGDSRLSIARRADIGDRANECWVSAASGWEIATKHRLGKLPQASALVDELPKMLASQGFKVIDVTLVHALRAGSLRGEHRDPFDRLIAAQGIAEGYTVVSADPAIGALGAHCLLA